MAKSYIPIKRIYKRGRSLNRDGSSHFNGTAMRSPRLVSLIETNDINISSGNPPFWRLESVEIS